MCMGLLLVGSDVLDACMGYGLMVDSPGKLYAPITK